jgi:hypothetical protein
VRNLPIGAKLDGAWSDNAASIEANCSDEGTPIGAVGFAAARFTAALRTWLLRWNRGHHGSQALTKPAGMRTVALTD